MDIGALTLMAAGVLAYSLVSKRLQMSIFTPPMAFTLVGVALAATGLIMGDPHNPFVELLAEFTLILVLFTDAMRIELTLLKKEYRLAARLLGIGLPLTIIAGTAVALWMFPSLDVFEAALLASILAPTDAALGLAVVANLRVPVRVRQTLNVESGLNDGIALTIVLFFIAAVGIEGAGRGGGVEWLWRIGLQLILGPIMGILIGFVGSSAIDHASENGWMNTVFSRISVLSLALLAFSLAEVVGGNGFIAAFVAGITVGNVKYHVCRDLFVFAEAEGQILTLLVFIVFGAVMVVPYWDAFTLPVLIYALLSLTAIRMIPVALSLLGSGLQKVSYVFIGWFGPRGIASIIYGLLLFEFEVAQTETLFPIVVLTVLLSTFLHGMSAAPLSEHYASRIEALRRRQKEEEMKPVPEMRLRHTR